jgi:hypothetical protein
MLDKIKEISKTTFGKLILVVAFVISFLAVKELKSQWFQSVSMQAASESASAEMGQEIELAQNLASTEKNTTEVLFERGHKYAASTLNAAKTEKEKLVVASNMFFGAYFLNTRTRANHCASLGVSIKSFVNAYEQKHHQLFVSAESIQIRDFEEHGYSYDIDKFYKSVLPSLEKFIAQEMKDVASTLEISEREACQSFEQDSVEWVNEIDYRKRVPEIAQILLRK